MNKNHYIFSLKRAVFVIFTPVICEKNMKVLHATHLLHFGVYFKIKHSEVSITMVCFK
jgi:hypothetical protein